MKRPDIRAYVAHPNQLRLAGKKALLSALVNLPEGQVMTYPQIKALGLDSSNPGDRSAINQVIRQAGREYLQLFHCIHGEGYKKTLPGEINDLVHERSRKTQRQLNRIKSFVNVALRPNYFDRMSADDRKEIYRKAASLGAISLGSVLARPETPALPSGSSRASDRQITLPPISP